MAWFTETEDQAREYGEVSQSDLKDYRVITRDSEGGVLVEKLNMRRIRGLISAKEAWRVENSNIEITEP